MESHTGREYVEQIEKAFSPIPIVKVPFFRKEVVGIDMLSKVGEIVYANTNPMDIFYIEEHTEIQKISNGHYIMKLRLPLVFDNRVEANVL